MTTLDTLKFDHKEKGYMDPLKLFKVLEEQAAEIVALKKQLGTTPYTPPEAH